MALWRIMRMFYIFKQTRLNYPQGCKEMNILRDRNKPVDKYIYWFCSFYRWKMLRNDRKAESLFNHQFPTSLSASSEMLKTSEKIWIIQTFWEQKKILLNYVMGWVLKWKRPSVKLNACVSVLSAWTASVGSTMSHIMIYANNQTLKTLRSEDAASSRQCPLSARTRVPGNINFSHPDLGLIYQDVKNYCKHVFPDVKWIHSLVNPDSHPGGLGGGEAGGRGGRAGGGEVGRAQRAETSNPGWTWIRI